MSLVEIKDFNVLISNKLCFDQPLKNKQQVYEKPLAMSRSDKYTTGIVLYYCSTKTTINSLASIY